MKQTIFTHIAHAMVLLAGLAACTDDVIELPGTNGGDNVEVPDGYYFVLDTDVPQDAAQTRVAYQDIYHSYFEEDDRLGIYAIDKSGNLVPGQPTNAEYRVMNVTNVVTGNVRQVLENVDPANRIERGYRYVIYYPYIEDMTINYLKSLDYGVQLDQNTTSVTPATGVEVHNALTGYEASDLLWDVAEDKTNAAGTHYVNIEMDHAMANIVFDISEEYLSANENGEYEVNILGVSRRAQGMNLTQSSSDSWKYSTGSSIPSIRMWNSGLTSSGARQFRAAIPAYQGTNGTITEGTPFLRIKGADGTAKQFKLKGSLTLLPGKYYHFSAIKTTIDPEGPVIPDVTDDDSWVLDVLDPETGQPVGLLCREYLRYQPGNTHLDITNDNCTDDKNTGETYNNGSTQTKYINSQAWVFYNLQPGTTTPELSKGYVLRFLYDIVSGSNYYWPSPHQDKWATGGLFTPEHGHQWIYDETAKCGISDPNPNNVTEYYMHSGTIQWDREKNIITSFTLPTNNITNEIAKTRGHIAIPQNGIPFISYSEFEEDNNSDKDGNKIGILVPRYLVDRRTYNNQSYENHYPLVKIGFNQFWISKPFRTTIMTNGDIIHCYNKEDEMGISFTAGGDGDLLSDAGYIYPYGSFSDGTENKTYDPYNNPEQMEYTRTDGTTYRPAPLYNKEAVMNPSFTPSAASENIEYVLPDYTDVESMKNYFGSRFAAKMCTRDIGTYTSNDQGFPNQSLFSCVCEGKTWGETGSAANTFTANIGGLNLKAVGYYEPLGKTFTGAAASACIFLKSPGNGIDYISLQSYSPWTVNWNGLFHQDQYYQSQWAGSTKLVSQFFAQVRLFMRFKYPTAGGASITTSTRSVSGSAPAESRNVYIPIQAID